MEERIKAVMEEDSLDNDSNGLDLPLEKETAKGQPRASVDRDEEDKKTIKIVMSNNQLPRIAPPLLHHPTSDSGSLKSKLKLSSRRKTQTDEQNMPNQSNNGGSMQSDDHQARLRESLREFERMSLKAKDTKGPGQSKKNSNIISDLDQTRNTTPLNRKQKYFDNSNTTNRLQIQGQEDPQDDEQAAKNEFQLFYERETNYTFWSFMTSKEIPVIKKLANGYFLVIFVLATAMSVLSLVTYSESRCQMDLGPSVVFYIYFGVSVLMRFSFYIFLQLELHGKIAYTLKVVFDDKIPHLVPLVIALCVPALLIGFYSFDYKACAASSVLFRDRFAIEMLATRLGITFLVYLGLFAGSSLLTAG
jgi:hypothetical protein